MLRGRDDEERVNPVQPGDSIQIPVGTSFQFRVGEVTVLKLLLVTAPPWPGAQEAAPTEGKWAPSVEPA